MSLQQPKNVPINDSEYRLLEDYVYMWEALGFKNRLVIPEGYVNDGASVPRPLWWFIRPDGLIRAAALLHDYIYEHKGKLPKNTHQILKDGVWIDASYTWTRNDADRLFCRVMREAGVSKFKRRAAYYAVIVGGFFYWRQPYVPVITSFNKLRNLINK